MKTWAGSPAAAAYALIAPAAFPALGTASALAPNSSARDTAVVIDPTGGGTGLVGMWKAFAEMEELGLIGAARPRMVAVQSTGCAPIVRAFHDGAQFAEMWADAATVAAGLRVPVAVGDFLILEALRESGGTAVAVDDADLLADTGLLGSLTGIFAAPEGAACLTAQKQLLADGWLDGSERVLLFNTGSGLKYTHLSG
jgi:threonine synthase